MSEQVTEINNILKALNEFEVTHSYTVYSPTYKKEISYKQLTTEQLKTLYKTTIHTGVLNVEFNQVLNNILKKNCLGLSGNKSYI